MTVITVSDNEELTCEIIFFIGIDAMLLGGKHNRMFRCSSVVWSEWLWFQQYRMWEPSVNLFALP